MYVTANHTHPSWYNMGPLNTYFVSRLSSLYGLSPHETKLHRWFEGWEKAMEEAARGSTRVTRHRGGGVGRPLHLRRGGVEVSKAGIVTARSERQRQSCSVNVSSAPLREEMSS